MNERNSMRRRSSGTTLQLYCIPGLELFGLEFQIYSPSEAVNRANFFYT